MSLFSSTLLHAYVKLGKRAARKDPRTLQFADYSANMPAAPVKRFGPTPALAGYSQKLSNIGMLRNDELGDCTCAGAAHMVQVWLQLNGTPYIPLDDQVLSLYEAVGGWVPGNPSTDNGAVLLDVLRYWKANGILPLPTLAGTGTIGARQLMAFAEVKAQEPEQVRRAIWYFGGAYIGLQLPLSAQSQDVWDVPFYGARLKGKPGSWGGRYTRKGGKNRPRRGNYVACPWYPSRAAQSVSAVNWTMSPKAMLAEFKSMWTATATSPANNANVSTRRSTGAPATSRGTPEKNAPSVTINAARPRVPVSAAIESGRSCGSKAIGVFAPGASGARITG